MRRFIKRRVAHWTREYAEHTRLSRLLNGTNIAQHAEHYARRARRHLAFWRALAEGNEGGDRG